MQREKDDIEFGQLLKRYQPQVGKNEWFTRKVMNRLPERRHSIRWIQPAVFVVCFIICALSWGYLFITQDYNVILVKDLVAFGAVLVATIVLLWQFLVSLFQSE